MTAENSLVLTTNPGLEDLVLDELRERASAAGLDAGSLRRQPSPIQGRVPVRAALSGSALEDLARGMRSVHHLVRPLLELELPAERPLEAIGEVFAGLEIPELVEGRSFRVRAHRIGSHDFASPDIERVAGAAIVARTGAPVDLTGYQVNVRVDVVERRCAIGIQLTRNPLSYRYEGYERPRVALKANVAYGLLRLARVDQQTRRLADPFCGSGTVLMEAGQLLPAARLWGGDWHARLVASAGRNIERAGLADRVELAQVDARELTAALAPGSVDAVVTNPPYGLKIGQRIEFTGFYSAFLEQAYRVLVPGGRLVVMARRRGALNRAVRRVGGLHIRSVRVIEIGGVYPGIFVMDRD